MKHPALHSGPVHELLHEFSELSRSHNRILSDHDAGGTSELAADETTLVHCTERQRVLDDHVIDARSLEPAAKLGHSLHVESGEIGVIERLSGAQLLGQIGDDLFFL